MMKFLLTILTLAAYAIHALATEPTDSVGTEPSVNLDEVEIVVQKKLVQSDGATLTYNVADDPEASGSPIIEILRKVPGVSVDADDNIRVNGKSNFKTLLNGKEDAMLSGDLKTALRSIPANSILKIEVISEPGAKYDAEGLGGILNIVTDRKRSLEGFLAQISGWLTNRSASGYIDARGKINKVMLNANVSHSNNRLYKIESTGQEKTEYLNNTEISTMIADSRSHAFSDYTQFRANMSWEPDALNLFTLSANYALGNTDNYAYGNRRMIAPTGTQLWKLDRNIYTDSGSDAVGAQASYQHTFGREGHNLVISYLFDSYAMSGFSDIFSTGQVDISEYPYQRISQSTHRINHIAQVDYANPIDTHNTFEAGAKLTWWRDHNDTTPSYGTDLDDATVRESECSDIMPYRDIYALYISHTGKYGNLGTKAGVRYEHTDIGMKYYTDNGSDFCQRLNDIVPNLAVSYNITQAQSLRAAYQMRISRPWTSALNPWVNTLTPGEISYGNPDLKSSIMHGVSLVYSNYEGKVAGSLKLKYDHTSNGIHDILFLKDGVMHKTFANVGRQDYYGCEGNLSWNPTAAFQLDFFGNGTYIDLRTDSKDFKAHNSGWQFNAGGSTNWRLPHEWRISGWGGFWTPWIDLQSRGIDTGYYYGIGISKAFLPERALVLTLNANSFAPWYRNGGYDTKSEDMIYSYRWKALQGQISFSISYRIGNLKSNVRQTAAQVQIEQSAAPSNKN